MRIPGAGDLAPARRRRYGGSYGRRRHQRNVRLGVAVLLVAVAAGGAYLLRHDDTKAPSRIAEQQPTACPSAVTPTQQPPLAVALPATSAVQLMVLNGTPRSGLAKTVADQLAAQGFVVRGQGNAPKALIGGSTVVFGAGAQPAATLVSRWVRGSHVAGSATAPRGSVQLVLGSDYQRLSTPAEVAAAGRAPAIPPVPTPTGCAA